jgi:hypothetical protein
MARHHRNLDDWEAEHGRVVRSVPLTHNAPKANRLAAGRSRQVRRRMSLRLLTQQRLDVLDKGTMSTLVAARPLETRWRLGFPAQFGRHPIALAS